MAKKVKENKKSAQGSQLIENPDVLAEQLTKTEEFLEKNKKSVLVVSAVVALIIAGFFLYRYVASNQEDQAQVEIYQAVYYFEADSLDKALNGDGNNLGFLDIIDEFGLSKAANLSHYYAGICYLKQGDFESSIEHLAKFKSKDLVVQSKAFTLAGDAHSELGEYDEAAKMYEKGANHHPNEQFSPLYLLKAGVAYEQADKMDKALDCYGQIVDKYKKSAEYQDARKQKARIETILAG